MLICPFNSLNFTVLQLKRKFMLFYVENRKAELLNFNLLLEARSDSKEKELFDMQIHVVFTDVKNPLWAFCNRI